jgi:lipopolysaccharide export system ATP-binding protein
MNIRLNELLNELQINHLRKESALSLSGGERRRVEVARTLATNPKFILLDEPFAGVDPIAVGEIQRIIKFLKQRNIGVLITDHNVRETLGICDHAYIISDGVVLAEGYCLVKSLKMKVFVESTSEKTSSVNTLLTRWTWQLGKSLIT